MSKRTRQKLKLVSSLTLCVLSLFSAVTLTFSWFSHNRDAQGGGMDITVGKETGSYDSHVFYRIDKTDGGEGILFTEAADQANASLGTYDGLERSYQCLLKIYVGEATETLTVTVSTDTGYFLGNPNKAHPLNTEQNVLSSVVGFKLLTPPSDGETEIVDGKKAYRFSSLTENDMQTFIDKTSISESTVPQNITITFDAASLKSNETSPKGNQCKAAYLLISYDPFLISAVFSVNIGVPEIENATSIPFQCDFRLTLDDTLSSE